MTLTESHLFCDVCRALELIIKWHSSLVSAGINTDVKPVRKSAIDKFRPCLIHLSVTWPICLADSIYYKQAFHYQMSSCHIKDQLIGTGL